MYEVSNQVESSNKEMALSYKHVLYDAETISNHT